MVITDPFRSALDAIRHIRSAQNAMPSDGQIGIFISHAGSNVEWATWLCRLLEKAGYWTFLHENDSEIGANILKEIYAKLGQCHWVACLLSTAYLESNWCQAELTYAFDKGKLFGLRIEDCEVEGLVKTRVYLDLVDCTGKEAEERIP